MARSNLNFNDTDPKLDECRTEHIVGDFSRCLIKNPKCLYAYPAGPSCTYCLHQCNRNFERSSFAGSSSRIEQRA